MEVEPRLVPTATATFCVFVFPAHLDQTNPSEPAHQMKGMGGGGGERPRTRTEGVLREESAAGDGEMGMAVFEHSSVERLPQIRGFPRMLQEQEPNQRQKPETSGGGRRRSREEGEGESSDLKVLAGNGGTGPERLL